MSVEPRRGCGFRKVGGLYLVGPKLERGCGKLPLELHVCPTCHGGIKQTRGWTWIDPAPILNAAQCAIPGSCADCVLAHPWALGPKAGLLWVGEKFYPEPHDFLAEAGAMGISRRIPKLPRGFELGQHYVLIAHPKAIVRAPRTAEEEAEAAENAAHPGASIDLRPESYGPRVIRKGIISVFKPTAIEKIVTESQSRDAEAMAELADKGISPVVVPDDDTDHWANLSHQEPVLL